MPAHLEIKRIDLWSLFKLAFFLYAILGLFVGLFFFLFSLVTHGLMQSYTMEEFPGMGLFSGMMGGVLFIFLIPFMAFFYGVLGSVAITICGWIFNLVCRMAGGLKLVVETKDINVVPVTAPSATSLPSHSGTTGGESTTTETDQGL
jgi:hypothetical protein